MDKIVTYSEHFIYFIYLVIEFAFNDIILNKNSLEVLLAVMIGYAGVNYSLTVFYEIRIYKVISWKDLKSFIFIIFAISLSFVGWGLFLQFQIIK